jgi:hypothetical protein
MNLSVLKEEIENFEDSLVFKKFYVILVGFLSVTANGFVVTIMLKSKSIRRNPSNLIIFAILIVDLVFGFWLTYYWYHEVGDVCFFVKTKLVDIFSVVLDMALWKCMA